GKPLPGGQPRSRLEPKLLGAAQHLRNANCPPTEAMADLLGIGANTVETRQHHQRRKAWISRISVTSLCRHEARNRHRLTRDPFLYAGNVNCDCWVSTGLVISVPPWPSLAIEKLDAMCWPSNARLWACRPSLTVRVPPVLSLFA